MQTEATYIIRVNGGNIEAINGADGTVFTSGLDARTVIQAAIGALGPTGGLIFIKRGTYDLSNSLDLADNVILEGESAEAGEGTRLTSSTPKPLIKGVTNNLALRRLLFDNCADAFALALTGTQNAVIEQCHFSNCSSTFNIVTAITLSECANVRIVECSFRNIQGAAIQSSSSTLHPNPTIGVQVIRCLIDGAGLGSDPSGAADLHYAGIHLFNAADVLVDGNTVRNCGSIGIAVDTTIAPSFVRVVNNAVSNNDVNRVLGQGHGIYVAGNGIGDYVVGGNVVAGNGGNGIEVNSGNGNRVVVTGNAVRANGSSAGEGYGFGIWVSFQNCVVSSNVVTENFSSGIALGFAQNVKHLECHGNLVANNGQANVGIDRFGSGIALMTGDINDQTVFDVDTLIQDNLVYDDQSPVTQQKGIYLDVNADGVVIEGNRVHGNGTGTGAEQIVVPANPNVKVRRNTGFVTENSGTANGGRLITVRHGLDITPLASKIRVTALSNPGGAFWVSSVTSTTFAISRAVAAPASFGWSYAQN